MDLKIKEFLDFIIKQKNYFISTNYDKLLKVLQIYVKI